MASGEKCAVMCRGIFLGFSCLLHLRAGYTTVPQSVFAFPLLFMWLGPLFQSLSSSLSQTLPFLLLIPLFLLLFVARGTAAALAGLPFVIFLYFFFFTTDGGGCHLPGVVVSFFSRSSGTIQTISWTLEAVSSDAGDFAPELQFQCQSEWSLLNVDVQA